MRAERPLFGVFYRAAPGLAVSWWGLIEAQASAYR
jgi:hypothetical protein